MPTINDVAKKAGVAVSTVSKVLKHYPNVSEATKAKVNEAIKELDYVPNSIASALSSKHYNRIALIININNQRQAIDEINMQYLLGAFHRASELNLNLFTVFSPMIKGKTTDEVIRDFRSEGITGILVYGLNKQNQQVIDMIDSKVFHCVVVDAPNVNEKTSSVTVDHYTAQYQVAKQTMEDEYCKHVLYLAGSEDGYVTDMRLAGIHRLQKEKKFKLKALYANFSEKKARELTFRYGDWADVIVCASDLMAIGAKNALKEMNIFRPVCGYDGITLMGYVGEQMNTVKQDFYHLSEVAIDEMQSLLNGELGRSVLVGHEIIKLYYKEIIT